MNWEDILIAVKAISHEDEDVEQMVFAKIERMAYPLDAAGRDAYCRAGAQARYTSNTDAACDLVERLTPGATIHLENTLEHTWMATVETPENQMCLMCFHARRPIAILRSAICARIELDDFPFPLLPGEF